MMTLDKKVEVNLRVNCGCGFKAETLREGGQHSKDTGHALATSGEIRPAAEVANGGN